jgi:hypothetical protein
MTIHQAKGMQWPVVFIPALLKNRFPSVASGGKGVWHLIPGDAVEGKDRFLGKHRRRTSTLLRGDDTKPEISFPDIRAGLWKEQPVCEEVHFLGRCLDFQARKANIPKSFGSQENCTAAKGRYYQRGSFL